MSQQYPSSTDPSRPGQPAGGGAEPYRVAPSNPYATHQQTPSAASHPSTTHPVPSPYSGAPGYQPYPGQAWGYGTPEPVRSPMLGRIGLAAVLASLLAAFLSMLKVVGAMHDFLLDNLESSSTTGSTTGQVQAQDIPPEVIDAMMPWATVLGISCMAGLVAWIVCIVAASQRRGRGAAIAGIVVGVLSPFIIFGAVMLGIAPIVAQIQR